MTNSATLHSKKQRKKYISLAVCIIVGIASGCLLGSFLTPYFMPSDPSAIPGLSELYKYDTATFNNSVKQIVGNNATTEEKANWLETAQLEGITPADITNGVDNLQLAYNILDNAEKFSITGSGKVNTISDQTIYSYKYYDGQSYNFYSISDGFVNTAKSFVEYVDSNEVITTNGSSNKNGTATWNGSTVTESTSDFMSQWGVLPSDYFALIISDETVLSQSGETINSNGQVQYKISLTLDCNTSVIKYALQQKASGGLNDLPTFSSVSVDFVLDSDWNLISYTSNETYKVSLGVLKNITCKSSLTLNVRINENALDNTQQN